MIKHIVMWKLKNNAEGATKTENAKLMKQKLEALPQKIEALQSAEVGINFTEVENESVCDVVLTTTCNTEDDLKAYAQHPEHQKVVQFILKVTKERRVVDYITN